MSHDISEPQPNENSVWFSNTLPKSSSVDELEHTQGFINSGNVSLMNSTLQCLLHCPMFVATFERSLEDHVPSSENNNCVTCALKDELDILTGHKKISQQSSSLSSLSPFIHQGFNRGEYYETGAFLSFLLDALREEAKYGCGLWDWEEHGKDLTIFERLFHSVEVRYKFCSACNDCVGHRKEQRSAPLLLKTKRYRLEDDLIEYYGTETRDCICERCDKIRLCDIKRTLTRAPNLFIIGLERDDFVSSRFAFPHAMELNKQHLLWKPDDVAVNYELRAVQYRTGVTKDAEHFKSTVKRGQKWWYVDGDCTDELHGNPSEGNVCMLYYERIDNGVEDQLIGCSEPKTTCANHVEISQENCNSENDSDDIAESDTIPCHKTAQTKQEVQELACFRSLEASSIELLLTFIPSILASIMATSYTSFLHAPTIFQSIVIAFLIFILLSGILKSSTATARKGKSGPPQTIGFHLNVVAMHGIDVALAAFFFPSTAPLFFFSSVYCWLLCIALAVLLSHPCVRGTVAMLCYIITVMIDVYFWERIPMVEWFVPLFFLKLIVCDLLAA